MLPLEFHFWDIVVFDFTYQDFLAKFEVKLMWPFGFDQSNFL